MNDGQAWWTDERIETLTNMVAIGHSSGFIAKHLGAVSRSAVCGKVWRLKLQRPQKDGKREAGLQNRLNAKIQRAKVDLARSEKTRKRSPHGRVQGFIPALTVVPTSEPRLWTTRAFGECAWPVSGEGADTFSCCTVTAPGKPYCEPHHKLAYQPSKPTVKELIRSVGRAA